MSNAKIVHLKASQSVFAAAGGRIGLFGYEEEAGTMRFQYGASPTVDVAYAALRNSPNTFSGVNTFQNLVVITGLPSGRGVVAGTGGTITSSPYFTVDTTTGVYAFGGSQQAATYPGRGVKVCGVGASYRSPAIELIEQSGSKTIVFVPFVAFRTRLLRIPVHERLA